MNKRKGLYVLGTHVSHNGSACLLKDGEICVAIEKERLTRVKHDGGDDNDAIKYCLDAAGITIRDVSLVVQNSNFDMFEQPSSRRNRNSIVDEAREVVTVSHHLAHAYGAYGTSPFSDAAVLVIDGCGNSISSCIDLEGAEIPEMPESLELRHLYFEKDSYYHASNGVFKTVYKDFSPWGRLEKYPMQPGTTMHSIGGIYGAVSRYVFGGMDDPGKLMGLAPYGKAGRYDFEIFDLKSGRVFLRYDWMKQFNSPMLSAEEMKQNMQACADLAYWVQREIERALMYVVNARFESAPMENLAVSGGVALNAVANRRLLSTSKFQRMHFQPAAGDNGLSIGCAYYGWLQHIKQSKRTNRVSTFHGRAYLQHDIESALERHADITATVDRGFVDTTAELLSKGAKVGWFQGGAEFGPRALGHRSILADPRDAGNRDFINTKVKFREDFRPFAPSVPFDDVSTYFDQSFPSPYMNLVSHVREEWRSAIPAVVHEDSSARVQTVTPETDANFYELHKRFKIRSGISVLLNTSLNRRGMPIVETPNEAIELLQSTALDVLVLENYIVRKTTQLTRTVEAADILAKLIGTHKNERNEYGDKLMLNVIVTGFERPIGVTSTQNAIVIESGYLANPDTTLRLDQSTLRAIYVTPGTISHHIENGSIQIPGKERAGKRVVQRMAGILGALMKLASIEK